MSRIDFEREKQAYRQGRSMTKETLYHVIRIISLNKKYVLNSQFRAITKLKGWLSGF